MVSTWSSKKTLKHNDVHERGGVDWVLPIGNDGEHVVFEENSKTQ